MFLCFQRAPSIQVTGLDLNTIGGLMCVNRILNRGTKDSHTPAAGWQEYFLSGVNSYLESISYWIRSSHVTLTASCNEWNRSWIIQQSNVLSITWFLPALRQMHWYSVDRQWTLRCSGCQWSSARGQTGVTNLCNVCGELGHETHCVRAAH